MSREDESRAVQALPADLDAALAGARRRLGAFGRELHYFEAVGSTNDVADQLALAGAAEGTTVVADAQTAGRGRLGRTWYSPPGAGLYVSVVLRPGPDPSPSLWALVAGVGLAEALRLVSGLEVLIKWPNDLVVGRKKVCGILTEGSTSEGVIRHVVIGFGINLRPAPYPADLADRATSLERELGRPVDRGLVLAVSLEGLASRVEHCRAYGVAELLDRWRALAPWSIGSPVEWSGPGGLRRGTTAGIDQNGALLVGAGGGIERIIAGEVRWL
jgi:BirA family biotin operon repressor/biotin-[acetyl-CoA-carboxylase] ligase